jgi:hypothetical protein
MLGRNPLGRVPLGRGAPTPAGPFYLLRFGGVNQHITFASTINIPANNGDSFAYVFDIDYNGNANQVLFANPASFNDRIIITSSTSILFRSGSSNTTFTLTTALSTGRQVIKIKKNGFNVAIYDGSNNALSAVQSRSMTNDVYGFGADSQSNRFSGDLYSAQIYSDFAETVKVHDWQSDLSSGTGTTWTDATAANNGTLNNFTGATDSWWVSYGSSSITITAATPNYSYAAIAGAVELTGTITVTGSTPNYSYSAILGTVELISQITITGSTPNYTYSSIDGIIDLTPEITITGATPNYVYNAISGTVEFLGTITVTGDTPNYIYTSIRATVQVGERIYLNNFIGEEHEQGVFNGVVKNSNFSGIIKQVASFNGITSKTATFIGVAK